MQSDIEFTAGSVTLLASDLALLHQDKGAITPGIGPHRVAMSHDADDGLVFNLAGDYGGIVVNAADKSQPGSPIQLNGLTIVIRDLATQSPAVSIDKEVDVLSLANADVDQFDVFDELARLRYQLATTQKAMKTLAGMATTYQAAWYAAWQNGTAPPEVPYFWKIVKEIMKYGASSEEAQVSLVDPGPPEPSPPLKTKNVAFCKTANGIAFIRGPSAQAGCGGTSLCGHAYTHRTAVR